MTKSRKYQVLIAVNFVHLVAYNNAFRYSSPCGVIMSTHSQAEICSKKKSALSSNGEKMKAILDRTRYSLGVSRGQRKYFTSREAVKQLNSLEIAPGTELIVNISEPIT